MPAILVPKAERSQELRINLDEENLQGVMVPDKWTLAICKGAIVRMAKAVNGGDDQQGDTG
jgi:hypothetical protein